MKRWVTLRQHFTTNQAKQTEDKLNLLADYMISKPTRLHINDLELPLLFRVCELLFFSWCLELLIVTLPFTNLFNKQFMSLSKAQLGI